MASSVPLLVACLNSYRVAWPLGKCTKALSFPKKPNQVNT